MRTGALLIALLAATALVQAAPRLDPGAPPAATRQAAEAENRTRPASAGPTLQSDAERHLRASFEAADPLHRGTLSAAEARAGGFGWIANHFDAIDTARAGRVSFDDVRRYLKMPAGGAAAAVK